MRAISEKDRALFLFNNLFHFNVAFYCSSEFDKMMESTQKNEPIKKRIVIIRIKETETVCMQTEQATLPEGGR